MPASLAARPTPSRPRVLGRAALRGAGAGLVGVAVMTVAEELEQAATGRADSSVPGRTLRTLLGRPTPDDVDPLAWDHAMHWGTGALLGALRGVWAAVGLRGPRATLAHTAVRLAFDQTMENVTGCGAPPRTWPHREEAWDMAHKTVYAVVTSLAAERWVAPVLQSTRGRTSH